MTKITVPSKVFITYNQMTDKKLPRQEKAKRVHHHQTNITRSIKGPLFKRRGKNKNINNKIAINTYYQQLNLKNKINE